MRRSSPRSKASRSRRHADGARQRALAAAGGQAAPRSAVRTTSPSLAVHAFLPMHDGQLGIASATAITAENFLDGKRRAGDRGTCWWSIRRLTADWLKELAERVAPAMGWRGAECQPARPLEPPTAAVQAFNGPDGRTGCCSAGRRHADGQAAWQPNCLARNIWRAAALARHRAASVRRCSAGRPCGRAASSTSAIVESETRFRDVADASSDWIFETDAEGRLTWISERFIALTGILVSEIEGRPLVDLLLPMSRRRPVVASSTARCRSSDCSAASAPLLSRPRRPAADLAGLRQADPRCRRPPYRLARHRHRRHGRDRGPQDRGVPERA